MYTIIAITFILFVATLFPLGRFAPDPESEQGKAILFAYAALLLIVACGIHYDMFGYLFFNPEKHELLPFKLFFIVFLVGIPINSVLYLLLAGKRRLQMPSLDFGGFGVFLIVFNSITLVASILGILSFYLEHVKK